MKSLVEEASSISKAIEQGWLRAGKPQEFSVKIFCEPEKNFFGLTVKSAKIAIFFKEAPVAPAEKPRPPQAKKPTPGLHPNAQQRQQAFKQQEVQKAPSAFPEKAMWNDEMVSAAQEWVRQMLKNLNLSHITFKTDVDRFAVKFNFDAPLTATREKEKLLFRSWAHLILQTLRHKFRKKYRGAKVILNSPNA